jgi:molybdopterin-guanine dinucleotide biosynthesis protein A
MNIMNDQQRYDAILVAGESKDSYKVRNQYKALLKLNGRHCIHYVIEALQHVSAVGDIYVIGPKKELTAAFNSAGIDLKQPKNIIILEQKNNLLENVWHAFLSSLPQDKDLNDGEIGAIVDKAVLVVPCDSPLVTAQEVDHFIAHCDLAHHDYVLGLTAEKDMEYFYPRKHRPGIKMAYLHMKEKNYRINNLHMVRPARVRHRIHINKMYEYRYQKRIVNMLLLALYLLRIQRLKKFRLLLGLQFSLISAKLDLPGLTALFKRWVPRKDLEKTISQILKTRFASLEVPYPGAALDIDNDQAYETLNNQFTHWRDYLRDQS